MNRNEILDLVKSLAKSQGFYSRLLEELNNEKLDYLEQQNFKDPIDFILFIEG